MSKEAVAEFLQEVQKDPDLQKELAKLATKHGYEFTADELNETELASVAGGFDVSDIFDAPSVAKKKKPAKK